MRKFVDLSGREFGRLTVIAPAGKSKNNSYLFDCLCSCGKSKIVRASHLLRGEVASCGCLHLENARTSRPVHGCLGSPTYESWAAMKQRCLYPKHPAYHRYGGRGITIYEPWLTFVNFLRDVGERPSISHSIDRFPDNDGNYEPGNVRWATHKEQCRNTSRNKFLEHDGHVATLAEWAEITGKRSSLLRGRIKRGWSVERTLTT